MGDREWWIKTRTPEARAILERVRVATRLSARLSALCYDQPEEVRAIFGELIGKPVDESLSLIPPFYADCGLNITVGKKVHIGHECAFTGHAPIGIADYVMIANRVSLVTGGHPVSPGRRRDYLTGAPITVGRNVWIGTGATILQVVTIGAGAVVAAGSVVTRDVRPATLVTGVPATLTRELEPDEGESIR